MCPGCRDIYAVPALLGTALRRQPHRAFPHVFGRALRRTFETQGKQLDSTLKTLSEKEALLTEAQLAVQQHKRSLRDQQWELKTLREEVQLRRNNRSGRSTPVHAASPTPMYAGPRLCGRTHACACVADLSTPGGRD